MKTTNTHPVIPVSLREQLVKEQTMQEVREDEMILEANRLAHDYN